MWVKHLLGSVCSDVLNTNTHAYPTSLDILLWFFCLIYLWIEKSKVHPPCDADCVYMVLQWPWCPQTAGSWDRARIYLPRRVVGVIKRVSVIYICYYEKCRFAMSNMRKSYPFLCRENATQPCYTPGNDYDLRKKGTTLVKLLFTTRWEEKAKSQTEEFSSDVFCLSLEYLQELECNAIGPVCRWGCWDTYSGLTSS